MYEIARELRDILIILRIEKFRMRMRMSWRGRGRGRRGRRRRTIVPAETLRLWRI